MSITFYATRRDTTSSDHGHIDVPGLEPINLSNANACDVIRAIGVDFDDYGICTIPIDEFINRCRNGLRAALRRPSPEKPEQIHVSDRGAAFIDCGRRAGYVESRLRELVTFAMRAQTIGATHIDAC